MILITTRRTECLSVKMAEQIRVPSAWLIFLVFHIVKVICSIVEHLGDDEGAFPSRGELMRPLLIHSEHKISFLKCSTFDVSAMESMQVLLIDGHPDQSHLPFFFQEIDGVLACLLCLGFREEFHSGSIVQQIAWKHGFSPIYHEERGLIG